MAQYESHFSFATIVAMAYAALGLFVLNMYPEQILLASVIVVIAGLLPDIDANESEPGRELGVLMAVIVPIIVLEFFPGLKTSGISRIALVVIGCYVLSRLFIVRVLHHWTSHRGIIHSIPAAIITFEFVFLLFWDLYLYDRLYLASAALVGFMSHLLLDAYGNLDIVGKAMGKSRTVKPVLKFAANSWGATITAYGLCLVLGWFIAQDIYPNLQIVAGIDY